MDKVLQKIIAMIKSMDVILKNVTLLYLTEGQDVAWNPREMGSTRVGGMKEGPASQAQSKISS
jgi:hypothetical protein